MPQIHRSTMLTPTPLLITTPTYRTSPLPGTNGHPTSRFNRRLAFRPGSQVWPAISAFKFCLLPSCPPLPSPLPLVNHSPHVHTLTSYVEPGHRVVVAAPLLLLTRYRVSLVICFCSQGGEGWEEHVIGGDFRNDVRKGDDGHVALAKHY